MYMWRYRLYKLTGISVSNHTFHSSNLRLSYRLLADLCSVWFQTQNSWFQPPLWKSRLYEGHQLLFSSRAPCSPGRAIEMVQTMCSERASEWGRRVTEVTEVTLVVGLKISGTEDLLGFSSSTISRVYRKSSQQTLFFPVYWRRVIKSKGKLTCDVFAQMKSLHLWSIVSG